MTFDQLFVFQKLEQINSYVEESKEFFRFSEEEILKDSEKIHIAERLLQLIVDGILDINQHLIKELNLDTSDDFQGTFYVLGASGVLPEDFARKIAPVVAVRNRIIHDYESLNKKLFIQNFRLNYSDFEKYMKLIRKYIEKK